MPATQRNRDLAINTPLGEDSVLIRSATITERMGKLFRLSVELESNDPNITFDQIIGGNATIRLELTNRQTRFFNGFVSQFVQLDADSNSGLYRATLVPWLWFLTRASNCRIFQQASVPDMIMTVFRDHGFSDFESRLSGHYTPWEYCVQYRETDFNFVSRLMEHEGIYYYFEHKNAKHTLILADAIGAHQSFPGYDQIPFRSQKGGLPNEEYVSSWLLAQEVQPGSYTLSDFNFEKPKTSLVAKSEKSLDHAQSKFEVFDYPGEYEEQSDGTDYSKIRIEELHANREVLQGQSNARGIAVGSTFSLTNASRRDQNRKYLITSASYHLTGNDYLSGGHSGGDFYSCSFTAIDADQAFRSARVTPKPIIQGPQTAIVVGPSGEEIHTDQYGRVKVQFHWDRFGKADENSSCWVRISQAASAGKKWGSLSIPRIGQEVIVEFLEGDPDRPIVTGQVYNGDTMPPYELPANKTRTTFKTNSTGGGGGFNELRFEDKKGSEQVFIHAERNHDVRVKTDSLEYVGHDRHLIVNHDQFEAVNGDKHQEVKGELNQKVGEILSISVAQNIQEKAGQNIATEAGGEIHIKAGMNLVLEAGASITLKAGGGFVVINAAGVAISGPQVLINSGGSPGTGAGCSPALPKAAKPADNAVGGAMTTITRAPARISPTSYSPTAVALKQAAADGAPFCEQCAKASAGQLAASDSAPVSPINLPRPAGGGYGQGEGRSLG